MASETDAYSHRDFLSPFTWRYGSNELRQIWSEHHYRHLWRQLWIALARAQHQSGLITSEELADLEAHATDINLAHAHAIERETRHDVMAEIRTFAEQAAIGGGKLHLGATSADIEDNADVLRIRESLQIITIRLTGLLIDLADCIEQHAETVCMAYTHLQPAEPTTLGYRFAMYAQDFLIDLDQLQWLKDNLRAKGMKGAVGTAASYAFLLHDQCMSPSEMERHTLQNFNIASFPITSQTYPRKQDTLILNTLAGIAQSAYRFAFDLRILQSPGFGELSEPFSANQVGSSAMPFKRNPRTTERVCSLTRYIMALPAIAYGNAAHSLLERTLDDSAARRLMFPEAFLGLDESLIGLRYVTSHINIHREAIRRNLERFGPFAGTERLLMAWVRNRGFNRQDLHEIIREASLEAWKTIEAGQPNPLVDLITLRALANGYIHENYATVHDEVDHLLNPSQHIGTAPERARQVASEIRHKIAELAISTASPAEPPAF